MYLPCKEYSCVLIYENTHMFTYSVTPMLTYLALILIQGKAMRALFMIMSKYHFQIFFQANFNISALFVISFLSQENVEAFNDSIPLGLNWIATVTPQHLVAALMNKNNRPSSSALFKNALIGNTFCIPHVHALSANLCLILIENLSPRRTLFVKVSLGGV